MDSTNERLAAIVADRAEELNAAAVGNLYEIDDERKVIDDMDAWMDAHEGEDEPQAVSIARILEEDSLGDLHFEVNQRGEIYGGKTVVGYGGPNVWIASDEVCGYWGASEERRRLSPKARDEVMEWFEDQWNCAKSAW